MSKVQVINPNGSICLGVEIIPPKKFKKKIIIVGEDGLKIRATIASYHTSDTESDFSDNE